MFEEKNVEGFGGAEVYHVLNKKYGGEKNMCEERNVVDFVGEVCKNVGLEQIAVRVRAEPYFEEEETGILDILDFIWTYGQNTGGFALQVEKEIPEFITIKCGYTPNEFSWHYYSRSEMLVTNGKTIFISKLVDTDGNTRCDIYRKYRILDATFAMIIEHEENNFNGDNEYLSVYFYGDKNAKIVEVLRRLNDLLAP
jgi:hypothetical protein